MRSIFSHTLALALLLLNAYTSFTLKLSKVENQIEKCQRERNEQRNQKRHGPSENLNQNIFGNEDLLTGPDEQEQEREKLKLRRDSLKFIVKT